MSKFFLPRPVRPMQVAIAHSVVTVAAHAGATEKMELGQMPGIGKTLGPFVVRRHDPPCFPRWDSAAFSPGGRARAALCCAVPGCLPIPWCVCVSLWPPRRASDKNASTGCLYTSSLLERGERKKGRKREEREVERGKEKERTRGIRQQLGGRRKEEEEGERKEEDGGSPCSRGSRSGTSPGGSGSRSRRCW